MLRPISVLSEVLLTYLRLPIFCELMDLHTSASLYPAISESDLLSLPIPAIPSRVQQEIATLVQKSSAFKITSKCLLEIAKRAVEIAIEENEDVSIAWIQTQIRILGVTIDAG